MAVYSAASARAGAAGCWKSSRGTCSTRRSSSAQFSWSGQRSTSSRSRSCCHCRRGRCWRNHRRCCRPPSTCSTRRSNSAPSSWSGRRGTSILSRSCCRCRRGRRWRNRRLRRGDVVSERWRARVRCHLRVHYSELNNTFAISKKHKPLSATLPRREAEAVGALSRAGAGSRRQGLLVNYIGSVLFLINREMLIVKTRHISHLCCRCCRRHSWSTRSAGKAVRKDDRRHRTWHNRNHRLRT